MKTDPVILSCAVFCIWPLVIAIPAYFLGRFKGRLRFRSPLDIKPEQSLAQINPRVAAGMKAPAPPARQPGDKYGA